MNRIAHIAMGTAALLLASLGSAAGQERDTSPMQPMGEMMAPGKPMTMMGWKAFCHFLLALTVIRPPAFKKIRL
jgi:hypothetical protein